MSIGHIAIHTATVWQHGPLFLSSTLGNREQRDVKPIYLTYLMESQQFCSLFPQKGV